MSFFAVLLSVISLLLSSFSLSSTLFSLPVHTMMGSAHAIISLNVADGSTPGSLSFESKFAMNDQFERGLHVPFNVAAPGVLANDLGITQPDETVLTIIEYPSYGDLTLNHDGSFEYQPFDAQFVGHDYFVYATDTHEQTRARVELNIHAAQCFVESSGDNQTDYSSYDNQAIQTAIDRAGAFASLKISGKCAGKTLMIDKDIDLIGGFLVNEWLATPSHQAAILDGEHQYRILENRGNLYIENIEFSHAYHHSGTGQVIYNQGDIHFSQTAHMASVQALSNTEHASISYE